MEIQNESYRPYPRGCSIGVLGGWGSRVSVLSEGVVVHLHVPAAVRFISWPGSRLLRHLLTPSLRKPLLAFAPSLTPAANLSHKATRTTLVAVASGVDFFKKIKTITT